MDHKAPGILMGTSSVPPLAAGDLSGALQPLVKQDTKNSSQLTKQQEESSHHLPCPSAVRPGALLATSKGSDTGALAGSSGLLSAESWALPGSLGQFHH